MQQLMTDRACAAQVSLPVVRQFVKSVEETALGTKVLKGVRPDQQLVKVVNDQLVELMGGQQEDLNDPKDGPQVLLCPVVARHLKPLTIPQHSTAMTLIFWPEFEGPCKHPCQHTIMTLEFLAKGPCSCPLVVRCQAWDGLIKVDFPNRYHLFPKEINDIIIFTWFSCQEANRAVCRGAACTKDWNLNIKEMF